MPKSSKAALLIIFVTVFIDLLGFGIVLPLLPRYAKHFAASDMTLGLLMASFSAMQFLFAPIWGRISDRVGRRPVLMLGLAGSTIFYGLFGYVTSLGSAGELLGLTVLPWLFISRIGAGIAGATIPTAQAYIADTTGPKDRAKGMALIGAAFGIGFTFGPLLGAAFVSSELGGPPSAAPGYVASVLSGIAFLSAAFLLPESLRSENAAPTRHGLQLAGIRQAVRKPVILLILGTVFLTTFAFAQFESTLSLLTEKFDLADRYNFLVFAYIGAILTISQGLLVRRLVPRLGEFRMSLIGAVLMTVGLGLVAAVALISRQSGISISTSLVMLCAVLPACVMGFSALTPSLQSLLSRQTSAQEQGEVLGVGQSAAALARILGPASGIPLFGWSMTAPYWMAAVIMAIGAGLILLIGQPPPVDDVA